MIHTSGHGSRQQESHQRSARDARRFDALTRTLFQIRSRRSVVTTLAGDAAATGTLAVVPRGAEAKHKKDMTCDGKCGGRCGDCKDGKTCVDGRCMCAGQSCPDGACFAVHQCTGLQDCPVGTAGCNPDLAPAGDCRVPIRGACHCSVECCHNTSVNPAFVDCVDGRCCWRPGAGCNPDIAQSCCSGSCTNSRWD